MMLCKHIHLSCPCGRVIDSPLLHNIEISVGQGIFQYPLYGYMMVSKGHYSGEVFKLIYYKRSDEMMTSFPGFPHATSNGKWDIGTRPCLLRMFSAAVSYAVIIICVPIALDHNYMHKLRTHLSEETWSNYCCHGVHSWKYHWIPLYQLVLQQNSKYYATVQSQNKNSKWSEVQRNDAGGVTRNINIVQWLYS